MALIKLILVSAGFLVLIMGGLYLALIVGRKQKSASSCSTEDGSVNSFGCGCGSGACGLPVKQK